MKRLILGCLFAIFSVSFAFAACPAGTYFTTNGTNCIFVSPTNPLPVDATVTATATIAGFHKESTLTPLAVSSVSASSGAFTAGKAVLLSNVGTTDAFCSPGASATTSSMKLSANSIAEIQTTSETAISCITASSTTTVNMDVGTGVWTGAGGGGSGSGGGSVTQGTVPWVVDGSAVVQPVSATALPLPTGAATSANQSTGNTSLATIATNSATQATAANQKIINTWAGGTLGSMANYGTSPGAVLVPGFNAFITNSPTVQPGNTANTTPWLTTIAQGGNSATVSAGGALTVDGSAVTQPVSAVSLPLPSGAATSANQTAIVGSVVGGAAASNSVLTGGIYNSAAPTLTNGQQAATQFDANGNLKVAIISGGGNGGTASSFGAAFPALGTAMGATFGGNMVGVTADSASNLNVNCVIGCSAGAFNNNADAVATSSVNGQNAAWLYAFNGTTFDRLRVDGSKNLLVGVNAALPAGANVIGHVVADSGSTTAVTQATAANLNATVIGTGTFATQSAVTAALNSLADGSLVTLGAKADAKSTATDTTAVTGMQVLKEISFMLQNPAALPANQSANLAQVNGVTTLTGAGASGTGSQRVNVAQDTTTLAGSAPGTAGTASANVVTVQGIASMTKLLVTPDSVALPANQSVNVSQINAVTPLMGNGVTGTGSQRVTIASDNTAFAVNATLSAETTKVIGTVNQGTSPWVNNISQINGVAPLMGNGATGTGALRVSIANDNTGIIQNVPGTSGGLTGFTVNAAASDNHTVVKNGAGQVYSITAFNNNAAANYVRLYNAGTGFNGCNSATNLQWSGIVPGATTGAGFTHNIPEGLSFSTGISICISGAFGNTDVTNAVLNTSVNIGYK